MAMLEGLNWVDYIFFAIFFFSVIAGFGRGFFREMFSLLTLVAAFAVAVMFANPLALKFSSTPGMESAVSDAATQPMSYMALGISFAVLFAGTVLIGTLLGYLLNLMFTGSVLGIGNRLLGGIFGLIRGFVIALILIFLVQLTPYGTADLWKQSKVVMLMQPSTDWVGQIISPEFTKLKDKVGKSMESVKDNVNSAITNMAVPGTSEESKPAVEEATPITEAPASDSSDSSSSSDASSSSDTSGSTDSSSY